MLYLYENKITRCANTGLSDVVSELLRALLNRLTDLEYHEEDLRACQTTDVDKDKVNILRHIIYT